MQSHRDKEFRSNMDSEIEDNLSADAAWDAGDLGCGELVAELRRRIRLLQARQVFHLIATDAGAKEDIPAWCRLTGHTLLELKPPNFLIKRKEE